MKTKIGRIFYPIIAVVLCLTFIMISCAPASTPTPSPTSTQAASPTPTPPAQKVTWKFTSYQPPSHIATLAVNHFADLVKQRSNGQLEIKVTAGAALVSSAEQHKATKAGIVDGGLIISAYWYGEFPLLEGGALVPFAYNDLAFDPTSPKMRDLRSVMNRELKNAGWNMMWIWNNPLGPISMYLKKPIASLYDLKGRRIRTPTGVWYMIFGELGAGTVTTSMAEIYLAAERGVIDGFTSGYSSYEDMKLYEVCPYAVVFDPYPQSGVLYEVMVNLDSFNKLPKDVQKVVLDTSLDMDVWAYDQSKIFLQDQLKRLQTSFGVKLITAPPNEVKSLIDKIVPAWQAKYLEKTGEAGRQIMQLATELSPYWKK